MHLGAVAAMLFRYHSNKIIQDVLTRLDKDKLIGTLVFSDPATGMEAWYLAAIQSYLILDYNLISTSMTGVIDVWKL